MNLTSSFLIQVCTFAKSIPGFKCLHHDDQVCLLKSCIFEVLLVRLSGLFDNQVSTYIVKAGKLPANLCLFISLALDSCRS